MSYNVRKRGEKALQLVLNFILFIFPQTPKLQQHHSFSFLIKERNVS